LGAKHLRAKSLDENKFILIILSNLSLKISIKGPRPQPLRRNVKKKSQINLPA